MAWRKGRRSSDGDYHEQGNHQGFWVGKAAHQIGADTGCGGSAAYLKAARLAADLTAYGIDLDQADPRDYVRGNHDQGSSAHLIANDNGRSRPMSISVRGDSRIYQLTVSADDGSAVLEVRLPIDFLRGIREAVNGTAWHDAFGSTIVRVDETTVLGLAGQDDRHGVRLVLNYLDVMDLEAALSTTLNAGDRTVECADLTGAWVCLERRAPTSRRAA